MRANLTSSFYEMLSTKDLMPTLNKRCDATRAKFFFIAQSILYFTLIESFAVSSAFFVSSILFCYVLSLTFCNT